tara:strand:+ start:35513 stop:35932 length:420 start_codon:yes stop_codon:yes gene_type:complete
MSYLPFESNPLIAVYENSGQNYSSSGEIVLQLDTNLHQGSLSNNTFTLNNFNCFLTSDVKYDKSGVGYGTVLKMYIDGSQAPGVGGCQSGNVTGYSSGSGGEIIASNVTAGQEVQIKFRKGGTQSVAFDTFTRLIGVII